jgi:hypothetical protein
VKGQDTVAIHAAAAGDKGTYTKVADIQLTSTAAAAADTLAPATPAATTTTSAASAAVLFIRLETDAGKGACIT